MSVSITLHALSVRAHAHHFAPRWSFGTCSSAASSVVAEWPNITVTPAACRWRVIDTEPAHKWSSSHTSCSTLTIQFWCHCNNAYALCARSIIATVDAIKRGFIHIDAQILGRMTALYGDERAFGVRAEHMCSVGGTAGARRQVRQYIGIHKRLAADLNVQYVRARVRAYTPLSDSTRSHRT